VTLCDIDHLEAALEVDEYDAGSLRPGLEVRITSRALPGVAFPGRVGRVGDVIGRRRARGDDPTVVYDSRVLEIRVPLTADPRLRPGMTVEGAIVVVRKPDVLVVPLRAVRTDPEGHATVHVEGEGPRRVELGARDRRDVEIVRGLEAGDVLTIGGPDDPR
jgi:HlyD family secretion protein